MKPEMKARDIIMTLLLALFATACNKWDCNGDLDGMWQLTEWRTANDEVKATKQNMIFYSFQLHMAGFRKKNDYVRTSLEVTSEQIRIYDPIEYVGGGHDEIQPMSVLQQYGVPEDGIFRIEVLSGSRMVLKTNGQDILSFRKY